MENKINFESLENITEHQKNISNSFLLYCAEKTARKRLNEKDKERRKEQFNKYKEVIMPDFQYSIDLQKLITRWWTDELKWYKENSKEYEHESLISGLLYRLHSLFFRNHMQCPFINGKKLDNKDFIVENQKLFRTFLNQSIKIIFAQRKFHSINDILPFLRNTKKINIDERVYSAAHKLHSKDWDIAKGIIIGGGAGVATSFFLGPVIGGYIGELAGLSGVAATSYGLAFLGGGSLAAGGFGMAGGSFVLGLGLGVANGTRYGIKNSSMDRQSQVQVQINLPALLEIGRLHYEYEDKEIPDLIHKTVSERLKELNKRYTKLSKSKSEKAKKDLDFIEKSIDVYEKAKDMSISYDWSSGYDFYQKMKKAI